MEDKISEVEKWIDNNIDGDIEYCDTENLMERYANYKTRKLEARIFVLRSQLKDIRCTPIGLMISPDDSMDGFLLEEYFDNLFDITNGCSNS